MSREESIPTSHQDYKNLAVQHTSSSRSRSRSRKSESSQKMSSESLTTFANLIELANGELNIKQLRQKILSGFKRLVGKRADVMAFYFVRNKNFDSVYSKIFLTRVMNLADESGHGSHEEESSNMNHLEYFDTMLNEQVPQHYKAILSFVVKTGQNVYIRDASNCKVIIYFSKFDLLVI